MKVVLKKMKFSNIGCVNNINADLDAIIYANEFVVKTFYEGKEHSQIAEINGKIIGYILCNSGWIVSFAILKEYQKKGIGKCLLANALLTYKDVGVDSNTVRLHVNINNIGAIELYKKTGFVIEETIPNYYGKTIDAYRMIWRKIPLEHTKKLNIK